jgi:hypothetical protein
MQHNKNTNKFTELEVLISDSEKLTSSLTDVMVKFNISKHFRLFDFLKNKGLAVSSLLSVLLILPFYGVANVYSIFKCGLHSPDFKGRKDVYYDIKNNEHISWRELLLLHSKRFIYLISNSINLKSNGITAIIFDDSLLEKTGKKIEKVSIVNDHVSGRFIIGFKLLVCGFWDGASFIPLDFSIHREKGKKQLSLINIYHKAAKMVRKQVEILEKQQAIVHRKQALLLESERNLETNPTQTCIKKHGRALQVFNKAEEKLKGSQKTLLHNQAEQAKARNALKHYYAKKRLFGLTAKERQEQYKKAVSAQCHGFKRRKEADKDKITIMIQMLCRVVKCGIMPDYVLIDSWFFCFEILEKLSELKKGAIKLLAMVKINNQIFKVCQTGKEMSVKAIVQKYERKAQKCKKLKSQYIKVNCLYKGIRVNLFFVRMGKCRTWNLLLTSDLEVGFIKLMEIYQIRWSIEVFFKESKQYLNLGSCQSVNFDAQIAETTISMMQHVMLSYFKRLNYQQSIGGLFKALNHEIVEIDLISRLIDMFWELIEILSVNNGIDFIKFQEDAIKNDEFMIRLVKLIPEKVLNKAA